MPVLKSQFTLRLNLADHAKIKKIAEAENRSMTNMIEMLIILISNQYIDNVYVLNCTARVLIFRQKMLKKG